MYTAFTPHRVSLADFRSDSPTQDPADQAVIINFGPWRNYRFKFDRVESSFYNFSDDELPEFPALLKSGEGWLRSAIPDLSFQTHLFTYSCHNKLSEGDSTDFLLGLSTMNIPGIGIDRGNGIIFHWDVPEQAWRVRLTADHSTSVAGGMFVHFALTSTTDKLDYAQTLHHAKTFLERVLEHIGLSLEREN